MNRESKKERVTKRKEENKERMKREILYINNNCKEKRIKKEERKKKERRKRGETEQKAEESKKGHQKRRKIDIQITKERNKEIICTKKVKRKQKRRTKQ